MIIFKILENIFFLKFRFVLIFIKKNKDIWLLHDVIIVPYFSILYLLIRLNQDFNTVFKRTINKKKKIF